MGLGQGLHGNMMGAGLERKMASPVIRDSTPLQWHAPWNAGLLLVHVAYSLASHVVDSWHALLIMFPVVVDSWHALLIMFPVVVDSWHALL